MQVAGDDEASAAIEHFIVQLEEENAALKRENEELKAELREERKRLLLELYNNSAISQFQFDIAMKELELLTTEEPTP